MVCAIEDAGFEIRDQIGWVFGSGFPKSHDVSKGIDRAAGAERDRGLSAAELGAIGMAKNGANQRSGFDDALRFRFWDYAIRHYRARHPRSRPLARLGHSSKAGMGADLPRPQAASGSARLPLRSSPTAPGRST